MTEVLDTRRRKPTLAEVGFIVSRSIYAGTAVLTMVAQTAQRLARTALQGKLHSASRSIVKMRFCVTI